MNDTALRRLVSAIREERARNKSRISELYAEVQKAGLDKKAVGEVVRITELRSSDPGAFTTHNELVGSYLQAVGESEIVILARERARAHARESIPADENRPLTIKERARAIVEFSEAQKRGEIPMDAELPERVRARA